MLLLFSSLTAGCGASAAETSAADPIACGVALVIESHNSRNYGSGGLADDLSPVIKWYIAKASDLPANQRTDAKGFALMEEYQADSRMRKDVAKLCVRQALTDPLYHELLPRLELEIPDPVARPSR